MTSSDPAWFRDTLGDDCSPPGFYRSGELHVAYVDFRGMTLAAASADGDDAALADLRAKVEPWIEPLRVTPPFTPVEELNWVAQDGDAPPSRRFVRTMSPERARIELDLGVDSALVFVDETSGNFMIAGRGPNGQPQIQRLGNPVHGDDDEAPPRAIPGRTPDDEKIAKLRAEKAQRIRTILRCPQCHGELLDRDDGMLCSPCSRMYPMFDGRPLFAAEGYDAEAEGQWKSENTYGQQVLSMIEQNRDGWVLDCGSGSPSTGFYNVVHLDLHSFPNVDVITDGAALPFADNTFDAVLSEAVLEHVRDPNAYTAEVTRVLKPGGLVRIDVAFMTPYHGVPDHFFNMTRSGLQLVVENAGLEIESIDPGPHQHPFVALSLMLNQYVLGTPDPGKKQRFLDMTITDAIDRLAAGGGDPFDGVTREGQDILAAGFSCVARKR